MSLINPLRDSFLPFPFPLGVAINDVIPDLKKHFWSFARLSHNDETRGRMFPVTMVVSTFSKLTYAPSTINPPPLLPLPLPLSVSFTITRPG